MGRYSESLASEFVTMLDLLPGQRALDVGCGPGALTARLVEALGSAAVAAVDPSPSFVDAARSRFPDADVRRATAEDLPFADDTFDAVAAQLVVHFMSDPAGGIAEMARVTRPGGVVAAAVWDFAGRRDPLAVFRSGARRLDPDAPSESLAGSSEHELVDILERGGLRGIRSTALSVRSSFASLDDWWEPFTYGIGPAGEYVARLDPARQRALRDECARLLPEPPFELTAWAWAAVGRA